jgi:hypothetical protein
LTSVSSSEDRETWGDNIGEGSRLLLLYRSSCTVNFFSDSCFTTSAAGRKGTETSPTIDTYHTIPYIKARHHRFTVSIFKIPLGGGFVLLKKEVRGVESNPIKKTMQ